MTLTIDIPADVTLALGAARTQPSATELRLVERLESGRAALPLLPAVAASALTLANNPDASIQHFSKLIETDPPIAARFLGVANSAIYARGRKVTSVLDAVGRIGLYTCRDLLFQAVYGATLQGLRQFQDEVQSSFKRSVLSAVICRVVVSELQSRFREGYLCGLLHDIGESRIYRIFSELGVESSDPVVPELVARYHPRAGAELAIKWKLPPEIVEVCGKHHEPATQDSEALRFVRIADWALPHVSARLAGAEAVDLQPSLAASPGLDLPLERAQAIVEGSFVAAQLL